MANYNANAKTISHVQPGPGQPEQPMCPECGRSWKTNADIPVDNGGIYCDWCKARLSFPEGETGRLDERGRGARDSLRAARRAKGRDS